MEMILLGSKQFFFLHDQSIVDVKTILQAVQTFYIFQLEFACVGYRLPAREDVINSLGCKPSQSQVHSITHCWSLKPFICYPYVKKPKAVSIESFLAGKRPMDYIPFGGGKGSL